MNYDMTMWRENQELRKELADARRWARAWKESARLNHNTYQDMTAYRDEAVDHYLIQKKCAHDAEAEIERLKNLVAVLQERCPIAVWTYRRCSTPDCEVSALVHPQTPIGEPTYCHVCANERRTASLGGPPIEPQPAAHDERADGDARKPANDR